MIDLVEIKSRTVRVLDPTEFVRPALAAQASTATRPAARTVAPRPRSLAGGVLALVDNLMGKGLADALVPRLKEHFGLDEVLWVVKDTVNVPPRAADWAEIKRRATAGLALYGA